MWVLRRSLYLCVYFWICVRVCLCILPRARKLCGHCVVAVWGPCGPALDLLNQLSRENGKYFGARSCYNYNLCFSCPPWWPRPEQLNVTVYMCHHINLCKSVWHNVQNTWKHQTYIHTCKKREIVEIYLRKYFWIFRKILGWEREINTGPKPPPEVAPSKMEVAPS